MIVQNTPLSQGINSKIIVRLQYQYYTDSEWYHKCKSFIWHEINLQTYPDNRRFIINPHTNI